jgi:Fe2+ transport system protein FeoA
VIDPAETRGLIAATLAAAPVAEARRRFVDKALQADDRLRRALREDLGTVPGREIQAVHERLLGNA